ncbi:MAG: branched-chain amino acid ABC transporter permease [Pseudomonadota bacterium]
MTFFKRYKLWIPIFVVFSVVLPFISDSGFFHHLLVMIGINIILVISLDMLLGHVGLISLGHAGFMGLGAYTCVLLVMKLNAPFLCGLLGGMALAGLFGALIGYPSLRLRGHYFVIVTFIVGIILNLLFNNLIEITKGPMGIPGIPPAEIGIKGLFSLRFTSKLSYYYLVLVFIFISLGIKYRCYESKMGKALIAIREDEALAKSIGIHTHAYKVGIFTISTSVAGIAGGLHAHYFHFIGPDSFAMLHSFDLFVMNLLGGAGTTAGPIVGPVVLTVINEVSELFKPAFGRIFFGLILILIILYMPKGIMGFWRRLLGKR